MFTGNVWFDIISLGQLPYRLRVSAVGGIRMNDAWPRTVAPR
jgi:hypothetical protein